MKFNISRDNLQNTKADVAIVFTVAKKFDHKWIKHKKLLEELNFKGESEEAVFLSSERYVYVGIDSVESDEIRIAAAKAYKLLKKSNFKNAKIGLYTDNCVKKATSAIVEGFALGSYEFTKYKSKIEPTNLEEIIICAESYDGSEIEAFKMELGLEKASIVSSATNYAKEIVNTAPQDYTPIQMAEDAVDLSKNLDEVTCEIFDEQFLEKQGMGAFLAVNRASAHPPRLIHLAYKPKNAQKKIIFVGKGLTYDSGGLSLKTGDYMLTMKSDKSGGAAVMAILKGAAELKLPLEIHAVVGATENMIGGNAYKPDDILKAKNGKTIEVRNTDAEGRLVLADCLCYAQELEPDLLIDMATLTGACVVALGEFTIGIMGHNHALKHELYNAAQQSGELANPLAFNRYLKPLIKSSVADISNVSQSRYGGAITAALFLDHFIKEEYKEKWLHLDIAGPAYLEKEWGYNSFGATGAGVRLMLYWLQDVAKKELK